ncbi:MAG: hypothetical protein AB7R69_00695 [Candidatus Babeliales bacterium]
MKKIIVFALIASQSIQCCQETYKITAGPYKDCTVTVQQTFKPFDANRPKLPETETNQDHVRNIILERVAKLTPEEKKEFFLKIKSQETIEQELEKKQFVDKKEEQDEKRKMLYSAVVNVLPQHIKDIPVCVCKDKDSNEIIVIGNENLEKVN